jgi:hypothetical protein
MLPAPGAELIEMAWLVTALPHALLTEYLRVSSPARTPVTTPLPETVALVLETLQTPPVAASVTVILAPAQTLVAPVMLPATGNMLTVTTFVADSVPQLPLTV